MGEVYGAEKLVDVTHTHTSTGEPVEWLKKISEGGQSENLQYDSSVSV